MSLQKSSAGVSPALTMLDIRKCRLEAGATGNVTDGLVK